MSTPTYDLKTRMYLNGNFVDISDKTFVRDPMVITRVRPDEASETPPQTCTATLNNEDLRFSIRNPMGPYYGYLQQNVPLEVMLRLVTDTFTRSVSNAWGSTDLSQPWTMFGLGGSVAASDFAVNGSAGTMSVPATTAYRAGRLPDASYKNVDVQCDVSLAITNITGGNVEPGNLMLRMQDSTTYYMLRAVITTAEAVTVSIHSVVAGVETVLVGPTTVSGLTHTSSQTLRFRMQAEGETIRGKVWAASGSEPLAWTVEVHDNTITSAGFVGIRNGVSATNSNSLPIVFTVDNFQASSMRFFGEVSEFPTSSDESDSDRYCEIEASGIMRRLSQGETPVRSASYRYITTAIEDPVAYWPLEEGPESTEGAPVIGTFPMVPYQNTAVPPEGTVKWGASTDLVGIIAAPDLAAGGKLEADVDPSTLASVWSVGWAQKCSASSGAQNFWYTTSGTFTVAMTIFTDGLLEVYLTTTGPTSTTVMSTTLTDFDEVWFHFTLTVVDAGGGTANFFLDVNGVPTDSDLGRTGTVAGLRRMSYNSPSATTEPTSISSVVVFGSQSSNPIPDLAAATLGFPGELALDRMQRLCDENGLNLSYVGEAADTMPMGAQGVGTLVGLLRECAKTDMGTLYESRGRLGFVYRTRASAESQAAALTLDAGNEEVRYPFQPREDDRYTANDVTADRPLGGTYRATQTTGPKSTQAPPDGVGQYDIRYDANTETDALLPSVAWWQVALGTVDEPRFPDLGVDLDAPNAAQHKLNVLDLDADDLVVVENATGIGIYDAIRQLVRGYNETWTGHRFTYGINASPASPYDVAELDGDMRLDSGSSTLNEDLDTTETGVDVATSLVHDLWATTAANPGEFPFDIIIGGERMTVTAITGSTSPQTFTVTRSVNGVVKTHSTGAEVHVFNPFRLGL